MSNGCVHYQFSCALKLARKYKTEHWSLPSKTTGQRTASIKSRHLDELTHEPSIWQCDTGPWLSCFDSCQLTILWMANIKDVDLPRHAWVTPPFLLIVSPILPVQSVDTYVRTYVRSVSHVTTKRKDVDHTLWVWGSVQRALRARGSPAIIDQIWKNFAKFVCVCTLYGLLWTYRNILRAINLSKLAGQNVVVVKRI